jgi:hypothetical protein
VQITVVLLLDSFMKASAAMELEEENRRLTRNKDEANGPLDPLLRKLCEEFVDDQDLTEKLHKLFKVVKYIRSSHVNRRSDMQNLTSYSDLLFRYKTFRDAIGGLFVPL